MKIEIKPKLQWGKQNVVYWTSKTTFGIYRILKETIGFHLSYESKFDSIKHYHHYKYLKHAKLVAELLEL